MTPNRIVTRDEWLIARKEHLAQEKSFTRLRDELSAKRRQLPWVRVDKDYMFREIERNVSLAELFEGRRQLIVYHFMFGPDWEEGCPSCSFWADNFDRVIVHLNHRDISMVAISNSAVENLDTYRKRMGWSFRWLSALGNDFNRDYHVSFTAEEMASGKVTYNFSKTSFPTSEGPGLSVFYRDNEGNLFHTYSCYARGLDMLNAAYHHIDLVPMGRDEAGLSHSMAWVRRHDQY